MRDIYHELIKHETDFKKHGKDELKVAVDVYASASRSICSALTLIGNLTLEAMESGDYENEDAARDLRLVGDVLRNLPRMAAALEQCSDTASYALKQRNGETIQ